MCQGSMIIDSVLLRVITELNAHSNNLLETIPVNLYGISSLFKDESKLIMQGKL
uniref:Uncharacterized protein n=1 Tax=Anguilla anguilla TaxID=7936 RepID=A0A0E9RLC2_ANGAN